MLFAAFLQYHKEVTRLVSGEMRSRLSKALVKFAQQWMKFVMEKCERGRGRRPRWIFHYIANVGFDLIFLSLRSVC